VTLGIPPTFPHTGYGYIERGASLSGSAQAFSVQRFVEKPNLETAKQYLASGDYFWNSGMFIWSAEAILSAIKTHLPELSQGLSEIDAAIGTAKERQVMQEVFGRLQAISIDYGVMEKATDRVVIEAPDIGWSDIGSWDVWAEERQADSQGNVIQGDVIALDSEGSIINATDRFVAAIGVRDLVVIETKDAILVCPKARVQDVRLVAESLKKQGRKDLL
jgi:mannose-1-phosphate guanylyltransferase